jgi:hypothetical protein
MYVSHPKMLLNDNSCQIANQLAVPELNWDVDSLCAQSKDPARRPGGAGR